MTTFQKRSFLSLGLAATLLSAACTPASTPYEQAQRDHEIACMTGTVGGALIGGVIGNQFGDGTGRNIMTGVGAGGGALAGRQYAC